MFKPCLLFFVLLILPVLVCAEEFTLENAFLSRTLSVENGVLRTSELANRQTGKSWKPVGCQEFRLRISKGTECPEAEDIWLTTDDFRCVKADGKNFVFDLKNEEYGLKVAVHYDLQKDDFFMRKRLTVESAQAWALECVEVEAIPAPDAFQPYTCNEITAQASYRWKPGIGQPLYTTESGTFWGVEFPASVNTVEVSAENPDVRTLRCAYLWGNHLTPGQAYRSYSAVFGTGDDAEFVRDAFWDYINQVRVRPIRLQVQYNSWFDFGGGVSREKFAQSIQTIHRELVEKRGCPALQAYVIDSGWERRSDVIPHAWPVNDKFDPDFATTRENCAKSGSTLGLWLSPACIFGTTPMVKEYREAGYEALSMGMSMCGPKYMTALGDRLVELTQQGVAYFKLDGVFGHLNTRDFELTGRGCPAMPQLETQKFSFNDKRLNDPKYDELKIYYLTAGAERLMDIFRRMHEVNPEVFIVISNGAWLSPWWLQSVDTVWMINAGDAAGGSNRTEELVYRDGIYHNIWCKENTQYPMVALFNHEPKKTSTGEPADVFRSYLFMHLSRGTSFLELYIKPHVLAESDWDVLAEGVKWAHKFYPTFQRARMFGGDPKQSEVYGYSGWKDHELGYISVHNPSGEAKTFEIVLDRKLGMLPGDTSYRVVTRVGTLEAPQSCRFGDTLRFQLTAGEVRVLEFEAF